MHAKLVRAALGQATAKAMAPCARLEEGEGKEEKEQEEEEDGASEQQKGLRMHEPKVGVKPEEAAAAAKIQSLAGGWGTPGKPQPENLQAKATTP